MLSIEDVWEMLVLLIRMLILVVKLVVLVIDIVLVMLSWSGIMCGLLMLIVSGLWVVV